MTVIVTGGRDYLNRKQVESVLDSLEIDHLIVGDCPTGVDRFAKDWAQSKAHQSYAIYPAHWDAEGRAAGPIRNKRMVEQHPGAIVLAFPGGRGTANCKTTALKAGHVVLEVMQLNDSSFASEKE